jgi:hypothetical protein
MTSSYSECDDAEYRATPSSSASWPSARHLPPSASATMKSSAGAPTHPSHTWAVRVHDLHQFRNKNSRLDRIDAYGNPSRSDKATGEAAAAGHAPLPGSGWRPSAARPACGRSLARAAHSAPPAAPPAAGRRGRNPASAASAPRTGRGSRCTRLYPRPTRATSVSF